MVCIATFVLLYFKFNEVYQEQGITGHEQKS